SVNPTAIAHITPRLTFMALSLPPIRCPAPDTLPIIRERSDRVLPSLRQSHRDFHSAGPIPLGRASQITVPGVILVDPLTATQLSRGADPCTGFAGLPGGSSPDWPWCAEPLPPRPPTHPRNRTSSSSWRTTSAS